METTNSIDEVKAWLLSMVGKMIGVVILQKAEAGKSEHVLWKGQGKVVRCVQEGVVLDMNAGSKSWWRKIFRNWDPMYVVPGWLSRSVSIPYCDLSISRNPTTGEKWLAIDAATWRRSPEELMKKSSDGKLE